MAKKKNDCPLSLHGNGQWYRAIRKKFFYFGKDKDAALRQWATDKDYLLAGLPPPRKDGRASIKELGNVFVDRCRKRVEEGELTERSADEYIKAPPTDVDADGRARPGDSPAHSRDRLAAGDMSRLSSW